MNTRVLHIGFGLIATIMLALIFLKTVSMFGFEEAVLVSWPWVIVLPVLAGAGYVIGSLAQRFVDARAPRSTSELGEG